MAPSKKSKTLPHRQTFSKQLKSLAKTHSKLHPKSESSAILAMRPNGNQSCFFWFRKNNWNRKKWAGEEKRKTLNFVSISCPDSFGGLRRFGHFLFFCLDTFCFEVLLCSSCFFVFVALLAASLGETTPMRKSRFFDTLIPKQTTYKINLKSMGTMIPKQTIYKNNLKIHGHPDSQADNL